MCGYWSGEWHDPDASITIVFERSGYTADQEADWPGSRTGFLNRELLRPERGFTPLIPLKDERGDKERARPV
jgi:hypothetical protein